MRKMQLLHKGFLQRHRPVGCCAQTARSGNLPQNVPHTQRLTRVCSAIVQQADRMPFFGSRSQQQSLLRKFFDKVGCETTSPLSCMCCTASRTSRPHKASRSFTPQQDDVCVLRLCEMALPPSMRAWTAEKFIRAALSLLTSQLTSSTGSQTHRCYYLRQACPSRRRLKQRWGCLQHTLALGWATLDTLHSTAPPR